RHGMHSIDIRQFGSDVIKLKHQSAYGAEILIRKEALLLGRSQNADPKRLCEVEFIASLSEIVGPDSGRMHQPCYGQTEERLRRIDAVPARGRYSRGGTRLSRAPKDLACERGFELADRPAENGDCHDRSAPHGVDIADGVHGRYSTKIERVVDNWH